MSKLIDALKKALLEGGLEEGSEGFKKVLDSKEFEGLKTQLEKESPESFDEFLKLPEFKSEFDKRITTAIQTRETNLKTKYDFVEKDGKDPKNPSEEMKLIKSLQDKIDANERQSLLEKKQSQALNLLSGKKIPPAFLKHFDFNSENTLEAQLKDVETAFNETKQLIINDNVKGVNIPRGGGASKVTDSEAMDIVSSMRG